MVVSEICIKRPVFATVLSLIIVLLGYIAFQRLTVREYPLIDEPVVSVTTTYRGASAEIMETNVTTVIERSLSGIEGIRIMSSVSRQGSSEITVRFVVARNPDDAAADVRDRVGRVRGNLPEDIDEPIIAKVQADAQPIIYLAFASDRHTPAQITDYVDRYVRDDIQRLSGVAEARIFGERRYAMRLWLDALRLAAHHLTPQDVEDALRQQNIEVPGGRVESRQREFTVRSRTGMTTVAEFNNLVVRNAGGHLIRLSDVGHAALGVENEDVIIRFNGQPAVAIGVVRQSVANPLDISHAVRQLLPGLQARLPDGMRIEVAYDSSVFIDQSIKNVYETIGEAVALVVVVIFFFLRSMRSVLIPLVTIPVSLIGAFAMMQVLGFSINTLTLLAMVLAIGLVVDDAIVVLENIHRHIEDGMEPLRAAFTGAREIGFAVVAMTLTLAAVYIPVALQPGRTGRLFTEFALTLAGAVLISGFVALTLSPMMCSRLLRHDPRPSWVSRMIEGWLNRLDRGYRGALGWVLGNRGVVLLAMLFAAGGCVVVYGQLRSELAPVEDRGVIIGVLVGPEGSTVDHTNAYMHQVERIYAGVPEAVRYFVVSGVPVASQGISFLGFRPWDQRERTTPQIARSMFPAMFGIPGVMAFPITPPSLGASPRDQPVQVVVRDSRSYEEMAASVDQLMAELRTNHGLLNLDTNLRLNTPQLQVRVNRDLVADLGIEVGTVGRAIETMLGGRQVTRFERNGQQYDVMVQLTDVERTNPDDLYRIFVRTPQGQSVPLSSLIEVAEVVAPRDLNHFNRARSVTISAALAPGYALGSALHDIAETAARILPPTASLDYDGQSREFFESSGGLAVTFVLALGFIYLVLAAQFESFIDPFIILLTVPLSMLGALLALQFTGNTLNVYSQIGLVTLIGLITKHGILITEFANQQQDLGQSKRDAVLHAAALRLRPILMTTGAMVLGSVPLALATGAGAESRHQLGWVIVGGLSLGTVLTLFVVPVAYSLVARDRARRPNVDYTEAEAEAEPPDALPVHREAAE